MVVHEEVVIACDTRSYLRHPGTCVRTPCLSCCKKLQAGFCVQIDLLFRSFRSGGFNRICPHVSIRVHCSDLHLGLFSALLPVFSQDSSRFISFCCLSVVSAVFALDVKASTCQDVTARGSATSPQLFCAHLSCGSLRAFELWKLDLS